jgi:hypothetical protein
MAKRKSKSQPTWTDVKAKLVDFDRGALLGLIQSLYTAHKDNQTFLHARFGLAVDVLEPVRELSLVRLGLIPSWARLVCLCQDDQRKIGDSGHQARVPRCTEISQMPDSRRCVL